MEREQGHHGVFAKPLTSMPYVAFIRAEAAHHGRNLTEGHITTMTT